METAHPRADPGEETTHPYAQGSAAKEADSQ